MSLDVHLYGERIGTLFPAGENDYRLAYAPERIAEFQPGAAVLSNSLPGSDQPYSADASRAFVEGLLPEGRRRARLAKELGIEPSDGYALIAEIGRDCAGGVAFVPEDAPEAGGAPDAPACLGDDELEELLAPSPAHFFDSACEPRMRFALAGVRHKLSLARTADDRWAWPDLFLPSTHIVKPETGEHPELVPNEMFCTTVAAEVGLPVASISIEAIAGHRCVVSERFDRSGSGPGAKRFHQETFCQALSFAPDAEEGSDEAEGPDFAEACGLLRAIGAAESTTTLIAAACVNYILGNGDAHGENFALMIVHDGALLAPFYDIASTTVYDDPVHRGMVLAESYAENAYLLELAGVCEEAGVDFDQSRRIAASVSTRIGAALETVAERARTEGWHAPVIDDIVELASERALCLGYEVQY